MLYISFNRRRRRHARMHATISIITANVFVRGRHDNIGVITATHSLKRWLVSYDKTGLYLFLLRNQIELDAVIDEVSALSDKKTLSSMCDLATNGQYSVFILFINFMTQDINKTFIFKHNC